MSLVNVESPIGYIDKQGRVVLRSKNWWGRDKFMNGLAPVVNRDINNEGVEVIPFEFDDATIFDGEHAFVVRGEMIMSIDQDEPDGR